MRARQKTMARPLIVDALLRPESLLGQRQLTSLQWDLLIRQGRRSHLLARLAHRLQQNTLLDAVPRMARLHLLSALRMVDRQDVAMRWEVANIDKALAPIGVKVVLLKGAAYLLAGLPPAHGRSFSDVDILVPKQRLAEVESELKLHGWQGGDMDDYDQRYYRRWMHEIPPMRHIRRGTTIDVHHAILPETARVKVNTPALLDTLVPLPGFDHLYVLAPVDMVLHSATHLFHEGGLENGLRDLFDLDALLRHFGEQATFWPSLVPRAVELGLARPLHYALRYLAELLTTPIPPAVAEAAIAAGRPPAALSALMDFCYQRALQPLHASCDARATGLARLALYVRSHWLRMPFPLLAVHLTRKAFKRPPAPLVEAPAREKNAQAR